MSSILIPTPLQASSYAFDPNLPMLLEREFPLSWQMTRWEKLSFIGLVSHLKPSVAIEIGNAQGGSLQVLAKYCDKVYAIDYQAAVHDQMKIAFPDQAIEYFTGDSAVQLPLVLEKIKSNGEALGLVLIDGNHTEAGVRNDINLILQHATVVKDLVILCHDSFNPTCRQGIRTADWKKHAHVHYVEVDYLPGNFYPDQYGACVPKSMWNGISLALLRPTPRTDELVIRESLLHTYCHLLKHSRHGTFRNRFLRPIKLFARKLVRGNAS